MEATRGAALRRAPRVLGDRQCQRELDPRDDDERCPELFFWLLALLRSLRLLLLDDEDLRPCA